MEWRHLTNLYDKLSTMASTSKGLGLLPKLKLEHIKLTSFSRMRVDLAAQLQVSLTATSFVPLIMLFLYRF